jgi:Uma2 family endonuclease
VYNQGMTVIEKARSMSSVPKRLLKPADFLAQERQAPLESEYYQGEVFAMARASRQNNRIAFNLIRDASRQLKGRPCEIYPSGMRVKVTKTGLYTNPDATIVCDHPQFEDAETDTLLNPLVIFEVLFPSAERYDRGARTAQYRTVSSLRECLLIAQDEPRVEHYVRQGDSNWPVTELTKLTDSIRLTSVPVVISLAELYDRVELEPDTDRESPTW